MKRLKSAVCVFALTFAAALIPSPAHAVTIDFDTAPIGLATPFSFTSPDLQAVFVGVGTNFFVAPTFLSSLTGNILYDFDFFPGTLIIGFDRPLSSISLDFAINGDETDVLSLFAFAGFNPVGFSVASGIVPLGFTFPEGQIAFSGAAFNTVVLASTGFNFAIDNIEASPIPEPGTAALAAIGLVGAAAAAHRKTSRAA